METIKKKIKNESAKTFAAIRSGLPVCVNARGSASVPTVTTWRIRVAFLPDDRYLRWYLIQRIHHAPKWWDCGVRCRDSNRD